MVYLSIYLSIIFATDFEVLGEPYVDDTIPYNGDAEDEILDDIDDNGILQMD